MKELSNVHSPFSQLAKDEVYILLGLYKKYKGNKLYYKEMSQYLNIEFFETLLFVIKICKFCLSKDDYIPFTHDYTELKMFEDG